MSKTMRQGFLLVLLGGLLCAQPAISAEKTYYRWLDERGNPVHSDRPPADGTDYEVVETGSSIVREVKGDTGAVPAETTPRVGNRFDTVDKQEMEVIQRNPEICARAQSNLETLNSTARVRIRGEDGEMRFLTEEEIESQRQKARDAITVHCE